MVESKGFFEKLLRKLFQRADYYPIRFYKKNRKRS